MKLDEYLFRNKMSKTQFAKNLGVTRTYIHDIIAKRRTPRPKLARKIEEVAEGQVKKEQLMFPEDYE